MPGDGEYCPWFSPSYIISLLRAELLKYSFTFIVVSHYEYGVCENECVSGCLVEGGGGGS